MQSHHNSPGPQLWGSAASGKASLTPPPHPTSTYTPHNTSPHPHPFSPSWRLAAGYAPTHTHPTPMQSDSAGFSSLDTPDRHPCELCTRLCVYAPAALDQTVASTRRTSWPAAANGHAPSAAPLLDVRRLLLSLQVAASPAAAVCRGALLLQVAAHPAAAVCGHALPLQVTARLAVEGDSAN